MFSCPPSRPQNPAVVGPTRNLFLPRARALRCSHRLARSFPRRLPSPATVLPGDSTPPPVRDAAPPPTPPPRLRSVADVLAGGLAVSRIEEEHPIGNNPQVHDCGEFHLPGLPRQAVRTGHRVLRVLQHPHHPLLRHGVRRRIRPRRLRVRRPWMRHKDRLLRQGRAREGVPARPLLLPGARLRLRRRSAEPLGPLRQPPQLAGGRRSATSSASMSSPAGLHVLRGESDGQVFVLYVERAGPHAAGQAAAVSIACVCAVATESKYGCSLRFSCFKGHHGSATLRSIACSTLSDGPPAGCFCLVPNASGEGDAAGVLLTVNIYTGTGCDDVEALEEDDDEGSSHADEGDA
ncbi:hypothetical protein EJB05_31808, partial [Eragrostis curvula]